MSGGLVLAELIMQRPTDVNSECRNITHARNKPISELRSKVV